MQQGEHAVTVTRGGTDFVLNRFYSGKDTFDLWVHRIVDQKIPRPESAREDMHTAAGLPEDEQVRVRRVCWLVLVFVNVLLVLDLYARGIVRAREISGGAET